MAGTYSQFFAAIRQRESSNNYSAENPAHYLGAYQFGEAALIDLGYVNSDSNPLNNDYSGGWTGKNGAINKAAFLASPSAQDAAAGEWWPMLWQRARNLDLEFYDGQTLNGFALTKSGMVAASHLVGTGALRDFIQSGGTTIRVDGNGTPITEYIQLFSDYDMPSSFLNNHNQNNVINGGNGKDELSGFDGNDTLNGGGEADTIIGGQGNDRIDGGSGQDIAKFTGPCRDYNITKNNDGTWTIAHTRGDQTDGTDTLTGIEKVQFGSEIHDLKLGLCGKDIVFVIDTTGSMSDDIASVKASATSMIDSLFAETQHVRIAIIGYKDPGETQVILNFTDQETVEERKAAAIAAINGIQVNGGGDRPEGVYSGLLAALTGAAGDWNEDAHLHRMIVYGDAEPKDTWLQAQVETLASNLNVGGSQGFSIASAANFETSYVEISTVLSAADDAASGAFYELASHNSGLNYDSRDDLAAAATAPVLETVFGTTGSDTLAGGDADGRIRGGAGNDLITGGLGNDLLYGEDGADTLDGGPGGDQIDGGAGSDSIIGGQGADTIRGGAGNDVVRFDGVYADYTVTVSTSGVTVRHNPSGETDTLQTVETAAFSDQSIQLQVNFHLIGGASDDVLTTGGGDDTLEGRASIDFLHGGDGNDLLIGGDDTDYIYGGFGVDTVSYSVSPAKIFVDLYSEYGVEYAGASWSDTLIGVENVVGSSFDDTISGAPVDNVLDGGPGIDTISYSNAYFGPVVVSLAETGPQNTGSEGNDTVVNFENLTGSDFNDTLEGSSIANILDGGAGDDSLLGGAGGDALEGGGDNDIVIGGVGADSLSGGDGDDVLYGNVEAFGAAETTGNTLVGGAGDDYLAGSTADDLYVFDPGFGADELLDWDGEAPDGSSHDTIRFGAGILPSDITVSRDQDENLYLRHANSVDSITLSYFFSGPGLAYGIERVEFADGTVWTRDQLSLWSSPQGTPGNDMIFGADGRESILGGDGNDRIWGYAGNDTLSGENGADELHGDSGNDWVIGGPGNDTVEGGLGIDTVDGGVGTDTLTFSSSLPIVVNLMTQQATQNSEADTLSGIENVSGRSGADLLIGDGIANLLKGDTGNDTLQGGGGKDTLYGGAGSDVFVYTALSDAPVGSGPELIQDFAVGSDKINLTAIDAKTNVAGDQAFIWIGTANFSNVAGQLRYAATPTGARTVYGDVNGDGVADFQIQLTGSTALQATDFLL